MKLKKEYLILVISLVVMGCCALFIKHMGSGDKSKKISTEIIDDASSLDERAVDYEVLNGSQTETLGIRRELKISKEEFQKISYEDIMRFFEDIDKYHGNRTWYTIDFEDGTGITIEGASSKKMLDEDLIAYGKVEAEGMSGECIGFITRGDGYLYLSDDYGNAISEETSPFGINGLTD